MMETFEEARDTIIKQLMSDDADVRAEYLKHFQEEMTEFSEAMAQTFIKWRSLDAGVQDNDKRAYISAHVYMVITLHILSMKLFLSGNIVAAGNLFRQAIESVALALLFSGKDLKILDKYMDDKYSAHVAVRDVVRHSKKLGLNDGVEMLKDAQTFYHKYSHPSPLTIAASMSLAGDGLYVGSAFDEGKMEAYQKEVSGRVSFAKVFPNFIDGVISNVAKW